MSDGDHNCLLSYLWDSGSAPVLNDLSENTILSTSNDFIKCMVPAKTWNPSEEQFFVNYLEPNSTTLTYAHLAVSPREIVEAEAYEWKTGTAAIVIKEDGKEVKRVYVDEGKKIYESIRVDPDFETIMRLLREAELLSNKGQKTVELAFTGTGDAMNAGPDPLTPSIFSFKDSQSVAAGNMPLLCKSKKKKKRKRYSVELGEKAKYALFKQRDLLQCFRKDENNYNFLPYMTNVMVMNWYSLLETHLFRINCSGYGQWSGMIRFKKQSPVGMDGLNIEQIMHNIFRYTPDETDLKDKEEDREKTAKMQDREGRKWWHMWLDSYKQELENSEKTEEYKDIRDEIIHKKYDILRKRERTRPPTEWLMKNRLITCD